MKRVLIIGSGGAGKSTFSRRLHAVTGLPLHHLDRLYWQPGWIGLPKPVWIDTLRKIIAEDEWIMDGNYDGTLDVRLPACDTVVFLDMPRLLCLYRVVRRRLAHRGTNRPDMAAGCDEKIDREFLAWIWNYRKIDGAKIERLLERHGTEKTIVRLRTPRAVEEFFEKLEAK